MNNLRFLKGIFFIVFIILAGCSKYQLSITQQKIDRRYLSSSFIGTPDPRQDNPPVGQRLVIEWWVPYRFVEEKPYIALHVVYWNYTEKTFYYPIEKMGGYATYSLLNEDFDNTQGILTYKADIMTPDGQIYRTWKHQLWVNLIELDDEQQIEKPNEETTVPDDSVSEPSNQGSVINNPYLIKEDSCD